MYQSSYLTEEWAVKERLVVAIHIHSMCRHPFTIDKQGEWGREHSEFTYLGAPVSQKRLTKPWSKDKIVKMRELEAGWRPDTYIF